MSTEDILREPAGAVWNKVDLHLHSPGVSSFRCPNGSDLESDAGRQAVAELYVEALVAAKIRVGALTDYNGVREPWFALIRALARNRGIALLPGAELSFQEGEHGLHVLAIFPGDRDTAAINRAIDGLDRDPQDPLRRDDRSHRDIQPRDSVVEALRRLREQLGCLLIPPHPTTHKGVFKTYKPKQAATFLEELRPDGLEKCSKGDLQRVADTGVVGAQWLDQLALLDFSDPKSIEQIVKPAADSGPTWLKLSANDLSALRLALHDPEVRIIIGAAPVPKHNRILGMEVEGSGFLGGLRLRWSDDLSVVIGGRGVGKSAILETLRYGLGLPPYAEESYREDLFRYALGSGGKVSLILERVVDSENSRRYRIDRVLGESPRVTEHPTGTAIQVAPSDLLGSSGAPTILGQREIYFVATSEPYRLRLLDDLIGEEAREREHDVRQAVEALRRNGATILDRARQLSRRDEYRQKRQNIDHEIETYERHGIAQKMQDATRLRADGQYLARSVGVVRDVKSAWDDASATTRDRIQGAIRDLDRGQSRQKAILEEAKRVLESLRTGLAELGGQATALLKEVEVSLTGLAAKWADGAKPLEEELNRVKRQLQTETLDPDRLLRLTEERTALGPLLDELDRVEAELRDLRQQRLQMISAYRDRRYDEHTLRRDRAREVGERLGGRLRLTVEFKGQKEEFAKRLGALLRGSSVTADAVQRLVTPEPTDGLAIAEAVRQGPREVQDKFSLTPAMAERLVRWLADDEARLFELEPIVVDDALHVELRVAEGEYRRLDRLSVGQRATAILLLLLAQERRPLVLDQPEDDLDNRFVYEDIVTMLRHEKGKRQILVATHNANIPVLGDAELIVALDVTDGHAKIVRRASLDDSAIREVVKSVMEGGEEAFRRRAEKYGGF